MKILKPAQKFQNIFLALLYMAAFSSPAFPAEHEPKVMQRMTRATETAVKTQQEMESWLTEKEQLLQAIGDSRLELEHLRYQEKKYLFQIKKEQKTLKKLEREGQEAERMLMELEPDLAVRVDTLKETIDAGLPFLNQERQERVAMLRESLMDHRLGLDAKLRRVLEAYLIETGYGRDVESSMQRIALAGQTTTVRLFRLGRLGLFYLTMDNTQAGCWSRDRNDWVPLPPAMISTLNTAMDIAQRKQAAEIVDLPVGRP